MKFASHRIDVRKGKRPVVRSVRQKNKHSLVFGIDPTTRSRETRMAKCIWGQRWTRRGIFGYRKLPRKRSRFVQSLGHILSKQIASRFRKKSRLLGDELISQPQSVFSVGKQTGMSGNTAEKVRVAVVNLAPDFTSPFRIWPSGEVTFAHVALIGVAGLARCDSRLHRLAGSKEG